ncbi:MAG: MlaD family protein [Rhodocyclaceae bacterium]|nr:MlaD family protein [Rhodocyclaceae bacterium]
MENRSHALIAGLFTVCFLLAAAAALWWFSGKRDEMQTWLLETRGNVTGLNVEAQVRYRGIRAGKVTAIRPDPADPAKLIIEISLARQYRLTDRSIAKLNFQGVTGLAYVMIEEPEGGRPLDPTASPPPRIALQPGLFDKLGGKAGDIAAQAAELGLRLNRLLDDRNLDNVARTLEHLARTAERLQELPHLVAQLRRVLADENLERLQAVLAHLERATSEAEPLAAEARLLLSNANRLVLRLDELAGNAGERLTSETLPQLEVTLGETTRTLRRLDRLIDTLAETPQAVLFGPAPARPGPGEAGFAAPPPSR